MTTAIAKRYRLKKEDFMWTVINIHTKEEKVVYQGDLLLELHKRGRAVDIWLDEFVLPPDFICKRIKKEKKNVEK